MTPATPRNEVETVEKLKALRNARPFVPFIVVVDDGRRFRVDTPYRIGIAPSGREVSYASSAEWSDRVATTRIKEVVSDAI